jgi:bud site selection protein 20
MGRYAQKKQHKGDKALTSKFKTKRRVKDHDQIHMDLKPEEAKRLLNQEVDFDRPGNAQFYCIHCARYFISGDALKSHCSTKPHKQRLKALAIEPYTQKEAERAAGMGCYKKPQPVDIRIPEESKRVDFNSELSSLSSNMSTL